MRLESRSLDDSFARELLGLRLWEPLDDLTADQLRELWARHPVLVVRRQALAERELADFSALFGPLERVVRTEWASPSRPGNRSHLESRGTGRQIRSAASATASSNGIPTSPT